MSSKGSGDYWDQIPEQCPEMTAYQKGTVQIKHAHTVTLSGVLTSVHICVKSHSHCRKSMPVTVHADGWRD